MIMISSGNWYDYHSGSFWESDNYKFKGVGSYLFMKKFIESNVICLSTMIILEGKCERDM